MPEPYMDHFAQMDATPEFLRKSKPIVFENTRNPYKSYDALQAGMPTDPDVIAARAFSESANKRTPMRAIMNGQEYQMESKGRDVRSEEAMKIMQMMQQKRQAEDDRRQAQVEREAQRTREQEKFALEKRAAEVGVKAKESELARAETDYTAKQTRRGTVQTAIEQGRFNDLGLSAQDGAKVARAYRMGGMDMAEQELAGLSQREAGNEAQVTAAMQTLISQGKFREAQALAQSAGLGSNPLAQISSVVAPGEAARKQAEAKAGMVGRKLSAFGERDTSMGWDPTNDDLEQNAKEIEALIQLYVQSGMSEEEAQNAALAMAQEKLGAAAGSMSGGWSHSLLQRIGAR